MGTIHTLLPEWLREDGTPNTDKSADKLHDRPTKDSKQLRESDSDKGKGESKYPTILQTSYVNGH